MSDIPTALEILVKHGVLKEPKVKVDFNLQLTRDCHIGTVRNIEKALIEFGQICAHEALKAASEQAEMLDNKECWDNCSCEKPCQIIDKDSILNSYPLSNIK